MAVCVACSNPLVLELDYSDDEDSRDTQRDSRDASSSKATAQVDTVPDDVELPCNEHFHYQCLLDAYESPSCPSCGTDLSSTSGAGTLQLLCNMNNEGGLQEALDILPLLTEERFLRAHPGERICRAFLELCREGDIPAIVDLLRACASDEDVDPDQDEPGRTPDEVLRYQDPIGDMQSALHAAVSASQREVAWLLLLLASNLPELDFPALVYQQAAELGVMRPDQTGKPDIRGLRDAHGRTAAQIATELGGVWHGWVAAGRLSV